MLLRVRHIVLVLFVLSLGVLVWWLLSDPMTVPEVPALRQAVQFRPEVPIVFTSRTNTASFRPEADEGEGFTYPGMIPWAADEGRLRLLQTNGNVYELTWGRPLPDGTTLIDVMSPSISIDGQRILFAGRKAPPDAGHWRIYEVGVDGRGLRQLTGGPDDPGCLGVPPLRFAADGARLTDMQRQQLDYDDIDPTDLGPKGMSFASSRIPDLGRDHARRATQIWTWLPNEPAPFPLTANRNNDRWPSLLSSDQLVFSLWSRVREGVTEDLTDVVPFAQGGLFATQPSEGWMGALVVPNGAQIGYAIKSAEPVWRPRPLFNGRITFMTTDPNTVGGLRLAQADWGYIRSAPSSLAFGTQFPQEGNAELLFGPTTDAEGNKLSAGCPSPYPDHGMLFAARRVDTDPKTFGLYLTSADWSTNPTVHLLFDDPEFIDAEPVAVYARQVLSLPNDRKPIAAEYTPPTQMQLLNGRRHEGDFGYIENLAIAAAIRNPIPWNPKGTVGRVDPRQNPLVPPPSGIEKIAFFSSHRDRFDDPEIPRIRGTFERIYAAPVDYNTFITWIPSDWRMAFMVAGLDKDNRVVNWKGTAKDPAGRVSSYLAFAGDHSSATSTKGYHYCNGCHVGHTYTLLDTREKKK